MIKATLKFKITLCEVFENGTYNYFTTFNRGCEVIILHEFIDSDDYEQCVIFSEELQESTTVHKDYLDIN